MNNDELKKKIVEIFEKAIGDWYEKDDGLFAEGYTPEEVDNRLKAFMADALIAAGLRFGENLTATFDHIALEREHELERRLSDAEYWKSVYDLALNIAFTGEERAYYLKRAEEKLKEGSRKDEQTCKIFAVGGKSDT